MAITIDNLNTQYEQLIQLSNTLSLYQQRIAQDQADLTASPVTKVARSVGHLVDLSKEINISLYPRLKDVIDLSSQYMMCVGAIAALKKVLLQATPETAGNTVSISDRIKRERVKFKELKEQFLNRYGLTADSAAALNDIIVRAVESSIKETNHMMDQMKTQAAEIEAAEFSTELRNSDPIEKSKNLPNELLVARVPIREVSQTILRDIGIKSTYQNIFEDLRKQGNIMVVSDFEHIEDRRIDEFIIAYIIRYIETFPLGTVNVHIFDQNTNYLYKRLSNAFQTENSSDLAKRVVQIHATTADLTAFRDVVCEDVFRKTSVNKPDLFSVYEEDSSDPFNLIILRDGLVDGGGYASSEILDTINSLSKPGEIGHRCGLRFLIVDCSASFEKNLSQGYRYVVGSIQQNCALKIAFDGKSGFSLCGSEKPIEVLHIAGDMDSFVQGRAMTIARAINSRAKSYISLDEVATHNTVDHMGSIMYIPVGKSGGNTVELPLSCKDEDGTVAGQCIGYVAIGQSGSGKSSFFHSLVLNGCMKYSPRDLQFWLLDFKNGGASSKYSDCGIPHIRIIAENNKIDDALCLFQMVSEEMERRSKAFNRNFTDNIIEYNKKALTEGLEYFPRIVIAIDEVQEIFREDNASVLQKWISSISTRMRSAGMHFVMVAQNLGEGKSYMLKEAFLPSATGRICFRVSQDIPRDSGFEEEFIQRRQEISELKTGEAYVSYGKGTIKKVKMAFVSPQEMSEKVFAEIREKYSEYSHMKPHVIGSKKRLSIISPKQGSDDTTYYNVIKGLKTRNSMLDVVLGEDVYRMEPFHVLMSQHENSSILFLGSDKQIASSLCTSVALSLSEQQVEVHLFNGDRTKASDGYEVIPHAFMYLCQNVASANSMVKNYRLDQLTDVMQSLYSEYQRRRAETQQSDIEDPIFAPVVLIINDLFGIESFVKNEVIENRETEPAPEKEPGGFNFNFDIFSSQSSTSSNNLGQFRDGIQNLMSELLKSGYRYNIHVVLAIKGDPSTWRAGRITSGVNNIMLFNDTEYADQVDNAYYLKEMLKNISNDGDDETVAVWAGKKTSSKIRPIIYKLSNQAEKSSLEALMSY